MLFKGHILNSKYEILKVIGTGGMSTVYLSEDKQSLKLYAVKEYKNDLKNTLDFSSEIEILKNLNHISIPKLIDVVHQDDNIYLIEEYIEGINAKQFIEEHGAFTVFRTCEIGIRLCEILEYLHGFNPPIIYRDLKPSNIMIKPNGDIALIDFGISRKYNCRKETDQDTILMGSVGFAAPEQYGKSQSSIATDIYGLGATLYFVVNGRKPDSFTEALKDEGYDNNVSESLKKIIKKAMQLDKERRYKSVSEIKLQLNSLITPLDTDRTLIMQPKKNKVKLKIVIVTVSLVFLIAVFLSMFFVTKDKGTVNKVEANKNSTKNNEILIKETNTKDDKAKDIIGDFDIDGRIKSSVKGNSNIYEIYPMSLSSRFNNKLIIAVRYIELKDNYLIFYCEVENSLDKDVYILNGETAVLVDSYNRKVYGTSLDKSNFTLVQKGSKNKSIKLAFNNPNLNSDSLTLLTKVISADKADSRDIKLNIKLK